MENAETLLANMDRLLARMDEGAARLAKAPTAFAKYWAGSATESVMADYRAGRARLVNAR